MNYVLFDCWYKVIDIWKARYMNTLILVGFVNEFIEICVNKGLEFQMIEVSLKKKIKK